MSQPIRAVTGSGRTLWSAVNMDRLGMAREDDGKEDSYTVSYDVKSIWFMFYLKKIIKRKISQ